MNNITIKTDHPVAFDSPDHLMPWGTMRDNTTNYDFIEEIHEFFKLNYQLDNFNFLDLGCSGGQLVVDFSKKGNLAIGLEGSDYSVKHNRANWPEHYNKILFTCDVTKPYSLYQNNDKILFDIITAWEVVEHIAEKDMNSFFTHINDNLKDNGIFLASISTIEDVIEGHVLHQSVFPEADWYIKFPEFLAGTDLKLYVYPFTYKVREGNGSFHILLQKQTNE
jgi:cyclopropane fatty-acyl-phospholipid synthase-like methyltransferase